MKGRAVKKDGQLYLRTKDSIVDATKALLQVQPRHTTTPIHPQYRHTI